MSNTKASTAKEEIAHGIEWDVIEGENTEFAARYPRMQFSHGEAKASGFMKSGGLFISKEQFPNFEAEGFEAATLITEDGGEIEGYAAITAKLAVIRVKHQWIHDTKYNRNVPLVQALVVAKGCPEIINLSLRGATKALEFQNAFNQHLLQNVSVANRTKPAQAKPLEPFALWFPIRAGASRKAQAKDSDKSSAVTPPELIVPEKIDRDYVATLWVGSDNYRQLAGYFKETVAWQKQKIWEQRDVANGDGTPEFTGGDGDPISPEQVDFLTSLSITKGFDLRELALTITNGGSNNIGILTKTEAREAIEHARAM